MEDPDRLGHELFEDAWQRSQLVLRLIHNQAVFLELLSMTCFGARFSDGCEYDVGLLKTSSVEVEDLATEG